MADSPLKCRVSGSAAHSYSRLSCGLLVYLGEARFSDCRNRPSDNWMLDSRPIDRHPDEHQYCSAGQGQVAVYPIENHDVVHPQAAVDGRHPAGGYHSRLAINWG